MYLYVFLFFICPIKICATNNLCNKNYPTYIIYNPYAINFPSEKINLFCDFFVKNGGVIT